MPSRIIATAIALIAFTAALISGIVAHNPTPTIIARALFAMAGCYVLGLIVGTVAQRAVQEHIDDHKLAHPLDAPFNQQAIPDTNQQLQTNNTDQNNQAGTDQPANTAQAPPASAAA